MPDELFVSNISTAASPTTLTEPTGRLDPRLDGEETSYFEWLGAGLLEVRDSGGAMHRTDRHPSIVTHVRFGFDRDRLFVRVDAVERMVDVLATGREVSLKFARPSGLRFSVRQLLGRLAGSFWVRQPAETPAAGVDWIERGLGRAAVAAGAVLEIAIPLADLGLGDGEPLVFFVAVYDANGTELERHTEHRPVELTTPDAMFEGRYWRA